ncbi:MAG: T9SS type A sorting domain-containing protein [Bacteroidia bacterium]|nr:T9SS type A sorting domain-containing protein [Bacteroidia bacterium]
MNRKTIWSFTATAVLGFFSMAAVAQSPVFSKKGEQYVKLSGATQVQKDSVWDDFEDWKPADKEIQLGFDFFAFGRKITAFEWSDGAIKYRFGDTLINIGLQADLCDWGYGTKNAKSPLYKKTEGSTGNRIVKLEWHRAGIWDEWSKSGSCKDSVSLQIWIYESPQKIEMRFGPRVVANFSTWFPDKLPVLCARYDEFGNTSGLVLDGAPAAPNTFPFADTGTRGITAWPAANQVYVFDFSLTGGVNDVPNLGDIWFANNTLFTTNPVATEVIIYTLDGRKVYTGSTTDRSLQIQGLTSGLYILSAGKGAKAQKMKIAITE